MTAASRPTTSAPSSNETLRTVGSIVAALLANIILSAIVDEIFHLLGVFPPWGQNFYDTIPFALAFSYRILFGIMSGYIAARLAPRSPMRHASILGIVGIVLSTGGAIASIVAHFGPAWYAIALVAVALPCARIGGWLFVRRSAAN
jgi:hypothetical protein